MPMKKKGPPYPVETVGLDVLEDTLSFYIRSINIALSRDLDERLEGLDVARGTGKITTLLLVDSHPGIRPSVIAQLIMRDRSAMGRLVDQMIGNELITRQAAGHEVRPFPIPLELDSTCHHCHFSSLKDRRAAALFILCSWHRTPCRCASWRP